MPKKKKTQKKSTKKKSTKKSTKKKTKVKNCPVEVEFVVYSSGKRLKNLSELAHELEGMTDDIFYHHVTDINNDFSNWIEHVFGDKKLAEELRKMDGKMKMQIRLLKHLAGVIR